MKFHDRLRHAREGRELIDHAPDIRHLANDGIGALVEDVPVLGDGGAVFAANALGRELDRRQRVLDLVGNAACHVGPRGAPLGADQLGDIVEGHDIALARAFARHADGEIAFRARAAERDLVGGKAPPLLLRPLQMRPELGNGLGKLLADELVLLEAQQLLRGAVDEIDDAVGVDAYDAGGHARQHRLHEAVALVEGGIGADQLVALALQLRRHGVEGRAQHGEVAIGPVDIDLDVEIAMADLLGRAHQLSDRRNQAIGEPHADPDRRQEQRQRDRHIHEAESHLHAGAALLQQLIFGDAGPGGAKLLQDARIHRADHVEIGVVEIVEALDGADHAGLAGSDDDDLPFLGELHRLLRGRAIREPRHGRRGGENLAAAVDQIGRRQCANGGLRVQEIAEALRLRAHELDRLVDVLGHAERVGADHLAVLLEIGGGDVDGILDDRLGADREPMVEAAVERDAGKDREQDRRHHGDDAEQADDAYM